MALRRSIPQEELHSKLPAEQREQHATDYQPSRGGWVPTAPKPVPGTPQGQQSR